MRRVLAAIVLLLATSLFGDDVAESRRLYGEALAAYQEKNYALFLERVRAASDLRPQHPTLLMQYAAALTLNGQHDAALPILERVASMGFVYDVAKEEDFAALRALPRFGAIAKRFEANARPIGEAKREGAIDRLALIPEGMAYDAKTRRLFIGSVHTRTIFSIDAKGTASELVRDLPFGVFGMVHDPKRNVLWAATSALPQVEGFRAEDQGKAALLKIDPRSGRVLEILRASDSAEHHFGDVALAPDGEVFVSDSVSPVIFRVRGKTLEPFVRGEFVSLQGIAISGSRLYVADYSKGIFAIDRRTKEVRLLSVPREASLLGVDGLYVCGPRTLIGTQNGTNPNRIIRIRLASGGLAVDAVDTLLANAPALGDPTLGVVIDNRFFFNGNAQWDLFADDGTIRDPVKLKEAVVLSVGVR